MTQSEGDLTCVPRMFSETALSREWILSFLCHVFLLFSCQAMSIWRCFKGGKEKEGVGGGVTQSEGDFTCVPRMCSEIAHSREWILS